MKKILLIITLVLVSLGINACSTFVESVDHPINTADDKLLNDETQANFVISGVKGTFAQTYCLLAVFTDGLSDELIFTDNMPGATFPQYAEMDAGVILVNNNSLIDGERMLGQLRFYADTLAGRAGVIHWTDTVMMNESYFTGYYYGAIARYMYASYFGLTEEQGGGCINLSPFIPSNEMYALALGKLDQALIYADESEAKLVHSLKARIQLYLGKYTEANSEAALGLASGDDPLSALFSSEAANPWWIEAGNGRAQWGTDGRFAQYIADDPKEVSRIQLEPVLGFDSLTYHYQIKYPEDKSPTPFITWQEMQLVQAEVASRNNDNATALTFVNAVRASHGLDARTVTTLDSIYIERDKEMFCLGTRLMDQRRFDRWHLPSGTWKYLPITQREREANPNLH